MQEIITTGGARDIVHALNAVAAWTSGGGYRGLLQTVMILAFIYMIVTVAFSYNVKALFSWFLTSTIMYGVLMVPTTTVRVIDTTNPTFGQSTVDNVPLGLAFMASLSSQAGNWITRQAEVVFSAPNDQTYTENGIIFGARLSEKINSIDIDNPLMSENVDNYIKKCAFYDLMLGRKTMNELATTQDLWASMRSQSKGLMMSYSSLDGSTKSLLACDEAWVRINGDWATYMNTGLKKYFRSFYPDLTDTMARARVMQNLPLVYGAMTNNALTAEKILQQHIVMNSFIAARANMGATEGGSMIDTFAQARADVQAQNTYNIMGRQAQQWVPVLAIVLTVVFYALFPILFPLFLMPQTGPQALKGYFYGFFYLASWGPLYAILNMFLSYRFEGGMRAMSDSGLSLTNQAGLVQVSDSISAMAGYMMASIPFIAHYMSKGAMAISGASHSFLNPAQSAASAAAADATTGNYNQGNVSHANVQTNNVSAFQQQMAPRLTTGRPSFSNIGDSGATSTTYAGGTTFDAGPSISRYFTSAVTGSQVAERSSQDAKLLQDKSKSWRQFENTVKSWGTSNVAASGGANTSAAGSQGSVTTGTGRGAHNANSRTDGKNYGDRVNENVRKTETQTDSVNANLGFNGPVGGATVGTQYQDAQGTDKARDKSSSKDVNIAELKSRYADSFYRKEDGSFNRVERSEYNSWSQEKREAYQMTLGEEASSAENASIALSRSADYTRGHSAELRQDLNNDLGRFFENHPDLALFRGGGARLIQSDPTLLDSVERAAYNKAMDQYLGQKALEYGSTYAENKADFERQYKGIQAGDIVVQGRGNGGEAVTPRPFRSVNEEVAGRPPYEAPRPGFFNGNSLARELGMGVKDGRTNLSRLDSTMNPVMRVVNDVAKEMGLPRTVVTSGNDRRHSDGSLHYSNKALDFRGNNITVSQGKAWAREVSRRLGGDYDVDFETFGKDPSNNHLHAEYDPPGRKRK